MALFALRLWGYRWLYSDTDPGLRIAVDRATGEKIVGFALRTRDGVEADPVPPPAAP
jgi:hypothetical protein